MNIEAMKQMVEALESFIDQLAKPYSTQAQYAITAGRQAIAEAEKQEPVAWCDLSIDGKHIAYFDGKPCIMVGRVGNDCHKHPLYTHPQPKVEQEPLFWYRPISNGEMYEGPVHAKSVDGQMLRNAKPDEWQPLYTHPQPKREWVGLTDEEREQATGWSVEHIEQALKEKNT